MAGIFRNLFKSRAQYQGFAFSRPLVVIQSDDWGRVGVRDRKGLEQLRANGLGLGQHPYDLYTLETADDVDAVATLLMRHRDSTGRAPCLVMNICTANLDFTSMQQDGYKALKFVPLSNGLPGSWSRPGLFEAYRAGIAQGIFYPALHGKTHFCPIAVEDALLHEDGKAQLLRTLWQAETPYIFWRMPWVGYEYWNPAKARSGFLPAEQQRILITQALESFTALFGMQPASACAPGCRSNRDTHEAWANAGIRVAESGTGSGARPPHMDEFGVLHLYRTIDFEPSQRDVDLDGYLEIARRCFSRGLPLIVSVHSINFHSTLKDFRTSTIAALDRFLTALESLYPELLYVHDSDMYEIVTAGAFRNHSSKVSVSVRREEWHPRLLPQGAV